MTETYYKKNKEAIREKQKVHFKEYYQKNKDKIHKSRLFENNPKRQAYQQKKNADD